MVDEVLELRPGVDHVDRLAHRSDPIRAVVELVWNSVDAEADSIAVSLERDDGLSTILNVRVLDDGHGISPDEVQSTFGVIGESWKRGGGSSKHGKRTLHGQQGEGRLRAFALGDRVLWDSVAEDTAGFMHEVKVSGSTDDVKRFVSSIERTSEATRTGTVFTATNITQKRLGKLEPEVAIPDLLGHFAPLLLNEPTLSLTYDGARLDPSEHMARDTSYEMTTKVGGIFILRVIEWKSAAKKTPREVHFSKDGTHPLYSEDARRLEQHIPFTAYVTWAGLGPEQLRVIGLGTMASGPVGTVWKAVEAKVREHFAARRREDRARQVKRWQDSGAYPYHGKPASGAEKAERAVFAAITGTLAPHIAPDKKQAKLTLNLLKGALQHDPGTLTTILHEVVSLSPEDAETFTTLLRDTTLPGIIHAANLVTTRRKVIAGL